MEWLAIRAAGFAGIGPDQAAMVWQLSAQRRHASAHWRINWLLPLSQAIAHNSHIRAQAPHVMPWFGEPRVIKATAASQVVAQSRHAWAHRARSASPASMHSRAHR